MLVDEESGGDIACRSEAGWIGYYGAFYCSELHFVVRRIDEHIVRWVMQKFKRQRGKLAKARAWREAVQQHQPRFFDHWVRVSPPQGRSVGAVCVAQREFWNQLSSFGVASSRVRLRQRLV